MATFPEVLHDETRACFELDLGGDVALCAYRRRGDVLDLVHTEVPPRLQGQGAAAHLVAGALDWARAHGLRVRPLCSYVASYMRRHPQTQDLIAP